MRWCVRFLPEYRQFQLIPERLRDLESDFPSMSDNLTRLVEEAPPHCRWIGHQGDHLIADIFLEGLEEEKRYQHREVVRHVGAKAQEGQLFANKILLPPVDQLIGTTAMIGAKDFRGFEQIRMPSMVQELIDCFSSAEVGIDQCVGARKLQQSLTILIQWLTVQSPAGTTPSRPLIFELEKAPLLRLAVENLPVFLRLCRNALADGLT